MGGNEICFFFTFWLCIHRRCCYTVTRFFCDYDVCFPPPTPNIPRERDDGDRGSAKWPFSSLPVPTSWELRPFLILYHQREREVSKANWARREIREERGNCFLLLLFPHRPSSFLKRRRRKGFLVSCHRRRPSLLLLLLLLSPFLSLSLSLSPSLPCAYTTLFSYCFFWVPSKRYTVTQGHLVFANKK